MTKEIKDPRWEEIWQRLNDMLEDEVPDVEYYAEWDGLISEAQEIAEAARELAHDIELSIDALEQQFTNREDALEELDTDEH